MTHLTQVFGNRPHRLLDVGLTAIMVAGVIIVDTLSGSAQAPAAFPAIETNDLNGRALTLPRDLPAEKTVVLVAFTQEQQQGIDTWVKGLGLKVDGTGLPWVELPVVGKMPRIARGVVNNGMRGGIPEKAKRAHVVTLFTDADAWSKAVGLPSKDRVYALVVDRAGNVLARQDGPCDPSKGGAILDAMRR